MYKNRKETNLENSKIKLLFPCYYKIIEICCEIARSRIAIEIHLTI